MKSPNGFSSGGRLRVHMCASSHHNKRHRWVRKRINELKQAQKAEAFSSRFLQMWPFRNDATPTAVWHHAPYRGFTAFNHSHCWRVQLVELPYYLFLSAYFPWAQIAPLWFYMKSRMMSCFLLNTGEEWGLASIAFGVFAEEVSVRVAWWHRRGPRLYASRKPCGIRPH